MRGPLHIVGSTMDGVNAFPQAFTDGCHPGRMPGQALPRDGQLFTPRLVPTNPASAGRAEGSAPDQERTLLNVLD
jgi:hypothetical protein